MAWFSPVWLRGCLRLLAHAGEGADGGLVVLSRESASTLVAAVQLGATNARTFLPVFVCGEWEVPVPASCHLVHTLPCLRQG